jgi:hypothetical protein
MAQFSLPWSKGVVWCPGTRGVAHREPPSFSMSFRGQKRPLLLFAGDEGDARLQRQLAAVEATRDRFDERDMVLVVVLTRGPPTWRDDG